MKKNFKRMIIAVAAVMCAVPMTNILSAGAADNTIKSTRSASISGASVSTVSTAAKRSDGTLKGTLTNSSSTGVIATEKIDDTVINGGKLVDREQLEEAIDIRDQLNGGIKGLGGRDILGLDDFISDLLANGGILNHGGRGRDLLGLDGILGKDDSIADLLSGLGHLTGKDFGSLGKVTGTMSRGKNKGFDVYEDNGDIAADGKGQNGNIHIWRQDDRGDIYTGVHYDGSHITILNGKVYDPFSSNNGNHASVTTDENGITFYDFGGGVTCKASEDGKSGSCTNGDLTITWFENEVTISTADGNSVTFSLEDNGSNNKDKKDDGQNGDSQNGDSQNGDSQNSNGQNGDSQNDDKKKDGSDEGTPIYDCDGCYTHNISDAEAAAALANRTDPLTNTGDRVQQRMPSDEECEAMLANRIDPLINTGDSVQQRISSIEELGAMLDDWTDPCVDPVR